MERQPSQEISILPELKKLGTRVDKVVTRQKYGKSRVKSELRRIADHLRLDQETTQFEQKHRDRLTKTEPGPLEQAWDQRVAEIEEQINQNENIIKQQLKKLNMWKDEPIENLIQDPNMHALYELINTDNPQLKNTEDLIALSELLENQRKLTKDLIDARHQYTGAHTKE